MQTPRTVQCARGTGADENASPVEGISDGAGKEGKVEVEVEVW